MKASCPDSMRVGEARDRLFDQLGYGDSGGYSKRWFRLRVGPLSIPVPNLESRVRALRAHDLHHVATGYGTTWIGEAELGAWEIASGCRDYWAAWVLDLWAFAVGLLLSPRRVARAFYRGRHSSNLYSERFDERWLEQSLGELRARLGLSRPAPAPSVRDQLSFLVWSLVALAFPMSLGFAAWGVVTLFQF